ncbi:MAG: phosphatidylserine decarboxylase, partial [Elusimicrobia bacterium]|nr:phosphatidylserine decarboxylase [Elusimicrobiota bacterium]
IVRIKPEGRDPVVVEQIAGAVARRIETWCKAGERVIAGERYGIIYFGSQCAVHLPKGAEPVVKVGDRVLVGVTPIARWIA